MVEHKDRLLLGGDVIFYLPNDDQLLLKALISASQVSSLMNRYVSDANIMNTLYDHLNTHYFRCDGALHGFIHTPDTRSLKIVKQYSDWFDQESVKLWSTFRMSRSGR